MKKFFKYAFVGFLAVYLQPAFAKWQLNKHNSAVHFVSVKMSVVAENHYFKEFSGEISDTGKVNLQIDLTSVETLIPIRNERMQKLLFETSLYPKATISADAPLDSIRKVKVGESLKLTLPLTIELHGKTQTQDAEVTLTKLSKNKVLVTNAKALLINASDFGLERGIEALRKVAGLPNIATAVPVNVKLEFSK